VILVVIEVIKQEFSVCKVPDISKIAFSDEFYFVGKTDEELSFVCNSKNVPQTATKCDDGWKAFRIQGVSDFSLIGILSKILEILATEKIGIFAISTYNTDYILTKNENFERALSALKSAGYDII
jgi:hypothetical protein